MKKWIIRKKGADFDRIASTFSINRYLARIIRNRDVIGDEAIDGYLNGDLSGLHSPWLMKDMERAVDLILQALEEGKRFRIIGDYDVDGVCSTYILCESLRELGATVDWSIPERVRDGYGLNERLVEDALADGVDVILTCDNGIAAVSQIALAKERGMTVIVTDHHAVPKEETEEGERMVLPPADAIINPNRTDCSYPFSGICGGVVAWKLATALYEKAGRAGGELRFLEFAAMATVGDVMRLVDENRIIVKEGLRALASTRHLGLRSLLQVNGVEGEVMAYHVGFRLGPCLNASGRLDTARRAVELLLAKDKETADQAAWDLKELNENRKELTLEWMQKAFDLIDHSDLKEDRVLLVFLDGCHESIAGIIAGRIRERYYRPVLVFTRSEDGLKASGRSVEAYDMFQKLSEHKELLTKFGGHPMAAGLSLKEADLPLLRQRLNDDCQLTDEDLTEKLYIDIELPISYLDFDFVESLRLLEPMGMGNEKPVFAQRDLCLESIRRIGRERNMLKLRVWDGRVRMDALLFEGGDEFLAFLEREFGAGEVERAMMGRPNSMRVALAYYPSINEFRGDRQLQIQILDYCVIK